MQLRPKLVPDRPKVSRPKDTGIDINPVAIQKGNELFASEGISNVTLSVGKADDLWQFQDKSFDVVLADAVLIYIGRDKIYMVIESMVRIARKGLLLVEQHWSAPGRSASLKLGARRSGLWCRDYVAFLKDFVPEQQTTVTKMTEDMWPAPSGRKPLWHETGAFIEVRLQAEANNADVSRA